MSVTPIKKDPYQLQVDFAKDFLQRYGDPLDKISRWLCPLCISLEAERWSRAPDISCEAVLAAARELGYQVVQRPRKRDYRMNLSLKRWYKYYVKERHFWDYDITRVCPDGLLFNAGKTWRPHMTIDEGEAARARAFIAGKGHRTVAVCRGYTSEDIHRWVERSAGPLSHGALIYAMFLEGYRYERTAPDSMKAFFNIDLSGFLPEA